MALSQTQKATIAIFMFGIAGFIIYNSFFKSAPVPTDQLTSEADQTTQDIIQLAETFDMTVINASVFSSPLFRSLREPGSPRSQEIQGRDNPFSQFGR